MPDTVILTTGVGLIGGARVIPGGFGCGGSGIGFINTGIGIVNPGFGGGSSGIGFINSGIGYGAPGVGVV